MPVLNVHDNSAVPLTLSFVHPMCLLCARTTDVYWGWEKKSREMLRILQAESSHERRGETPAIYGDYLSLQHRHRVMTDVNGRQNVDGFLCPTLELGFLSLFHR